MEGITGMEKSEVLLSIIIPFYNTSQYAVPLIQHLQHEIDKYKDTIEIVIVNDGSDENEVKKLSEYIMYPYTKLVNIENSGQSAARNIGIKNSTGKYIWFIDSDDDISNKSIEIILPLLKNNNDLITFGYNNNLTDLNLNSSHLSVKKRKVYEDLIVGNMKHYAWAYVVKRSIFRKSIGFFPENRLYEDTGTIYKLFCLANESQHIYQPIYRYRIREGSTVQSVKPKHFYDLKVTLNQITQFMKIHPELKYYRMIVAAIAIQIGRSSDQITKSQYKELFRFVKLKFVLEKPSFGLLRRYLYVKFPISGKIVHLITNRNKA